MVTSAATDTEDREPGGHYNSVMTLSVWLCVRVCVCVCEACVCVCVNGALKCHGFSLHWRCFISSFEQLQQAETWWLKDKTW